MRKEAYPEEPAPPDQKGWLSAWLDEKRAGSFDGGELPRRPEELSPGRSKGRTGRCGSVCPGADPAGSGKTPMNLEAVRSFAQVLEKQKADAG